MNTTQIEKLFKTNINKSIIEDYISAKNVVNRLSETEDWVKVFNENDWATVSFITNAPICKNTTEAKLFASEQKTRNLEEITAFLLNS